VPAPKRVYSDDEVRAILSRAIDRQRSASPEGLTHDDLLAVARDAGIPADAIEAAAAELAAHPEPDAVAVAEEGMIRKERASDFRIHLFTYLPIMAFLAVVNAMTTHYPWVLWPALGWGLALALHARFALFPTDVEITQEAAQRARKRRRAEEKERRRLARSDLKEGARELGHAVERGVAVLLTETAKRIHEEIGPEPQERGKRVRVEGNEGEDEAEDEPESEDEASKRR
jgi:hypothetical protein